MSWNVFQQSSSASSSMLEMERLANISSRIDWIDGAMSGGDPTQIHLAVSRVIGGRSSHKAWLSDSCGNPATSFSHHKQLFRDYVME
eukprot:1094100-Karenia_brevis.AAC.1